MLNHLNNKLFNGILFLSLAVLVWLGYLPLYLLVIPVTLFVGLSAYGSSVISSQYHLQAICSGTFSSENQIAITFDDGPDAELTPQFLQMLHSFEVPATFFCIGKQVTAHPEIVKQIDAAGHIVGNHSYDHGFLFDLQFTKRMTAELQLANDIIKETIGKQPLYFRPPYGVTTPSVAKASEKLGFTVVGWSLRSMDTVSKDSKKLIKKVTSELKSGDIVLFHDTQVGTVLALEALLKHCKANNIEVVALDKLTNTQAYA